MAYAITAVYLWRAWLHDHQPPSKKESAKADHRKATGQSLPLMMPLSNPPIPDDLSLFRPLRGGGHDPVSESNEGQTLQETRFQGSGLAWRRTNLSTEEHVLKAADELDVVVDAYWKATRQPVSTRRVPIGLGFAG